MLTSEHEQHGMTLVELIIAGAIAMIALSAVLTVYSATARHSSQHLQQAHIHQQLHALMHLISSDVKRAGYWHFDPLVQHASDNPFQTPVNRLRIQAYAEESPDSCILFSFDLDRDGLVGTGRCTDKDCADGTDADNVEQFGFRLRDAKLQSRYGGTEFDCRSGYWQTVNDPGIEITQLRFTAQRQCLNLRDNDRECRSSDPRLVQRAVEVRLHGRLRNNRDSEITLTQWVRIRNDQLREGE